MERCSKCVTPNSYPGIVLDNNGICNFCLEYENKYSNWESSKENRIKKLEKLIDNAKKRRKKFDVLVPLSGGKDSTYVFYLAIKKFKLKVLCYNFDNGFQSEIAKNNIKSAIEATNTDIIYYKPSEKLLMKLYKHFLQYTGMFCPVCMRCIHFYQIITTRYFNIPLVLKGSSKRTEENLVPEIFQDGNLLFFKNVLKKYPIKENTRIFYTDRNLLEKISRAIYLLSSGKIIFGSVDIQLPDYLDWDYDLIYRTITDEMGWRPLQDRDEHVDCLADPTVHFLRKLRCGDLTPSTLRYSAEIRSGQVSREKAIKLIEKEMYTYPNYRYIEYFLNKINITSEDLDSFMDNNLRHMDFQKKGFTLSLFNKIRKLLKKDDLN